MKKEICKLLPALLALMLCLSLFACTDDAKKEETTQGEQADPGTVGEGLPEGGIELPDDVFE